MNKEVNFSRFVGIAIVAICVIIVILALMSALIKSENKDNVVYVDNGLRTMLSIPKSNIVTEYVNIQKDVETEDRITKLNIKLPKINIETEITSKINEKIYSIYQNLYLDITNDETIEEIEVDYSYDYLENDTVLEIIITKKVIKNDNEEKTDIKYKYDIKNDVEI